MGFKIDIIGLIKALFKKKKNDEAKKIQTETINKNYDIRKQFIYDSGLFKIVKDVYATQKITPESNPYNVAFDIVNHAILDTCISILTEMETVTKERLSYAFSSGWECNTGVVLSPYIYVALIDCLYNNYLNRINMIKFDYNNLNLK